MRSGDCVAGATTGGRNGRAAPITHKKDEPKARTRRLLNRTGGPDNRRWSLRHKSSVFASVVFIFLASSRPSTATAPQQDRKSKPRAMALVIKWQGETPNFLDVPNHQTRGRMLIEADIDGDLVAVAVSLRSFEKQFEPTVTRRVSCLLKENEEREISDFTGDGEPSVKL